MFPLQDGHFENTYYSDFIANLGKIKYAGEFSAGSGRQKQASDRCLSDLDVPAGQSMNISSLDVRSMLPENLNHFFRYQGSLTTPPCYESILWTVFDTPITLSHNQVEPRGRRDAASEISGERASRKPRRLPSASSDQEAGEHPDGHLQ